MRFIQFFGRTTCHIVRDSETTLCGRRFGLMDETHACTDEEWIASDYQCLTCVDIWWWKRVLRKERT